MIVNNQIQEFVLRTLESGLNSSDRMKPAILFFLLISHSFVVKSQTIPQRNSIRFGASRVGLDAPDALGARYEIHYTRLLGFSRIKFEAKAGVLKTEYYETIHPTFLNSRKRKSLDLVINYNVFKSYRHAIYPGFGFSIWHRKDLLLNQVQYETNSDGTIYVSSFTTRVFDEINIGPYFSLQYEYRMLSNLSISIQSGLNSLGEAGWNSNLGLSLGCHF
ncbi:hypothetical protein ACS5NO_07650 [Larkinella sp. GY13]|uniref:hypothetical protein n=1 Tax=Larkinella sp. GY13 TaxID=3453720 RepID=UPI003EEED803